MTAALLLALPGEPVHAATEVPLDRDGFALVPAKAGARAIFHLRGARGALTPIDPRCPWASWLELEVAGTPALEIALRCSGWRPSAFHGHRYRARHGPLGVVIELRRGGVTVRLDGPLPGGAATGPPPGVDPSLELRLHVDATRFCGRFTRRRSLSAAFSFWRRPGRCAAPPAPNFVLINLDDARSDGVDRMPVLVSRLAAEGVHFENAFTPSPVCSPSRASLLTGRHALRHGTRHIGGPLGGADSFRESGADTETLGVWLERAGYATGLFGKYLNAYDAGSEGDQGPGGRFYVPPGWSRFWAVLSPERYGGALGGDYSVVEEDAVLRRYRRHVDDREYSTDLSGQRMDEFILDAVAGGRPFFAY